MPHNLKYAVATAVAAAALATSPALAKPLTGGAAAPSPPPDSVQAHYRDLFYRNDDVFTVRPIPTTAPPAQSRPVAAPPADDGDAGGSLLIGLGLVGAGVAVGVGGAMRRRRVAV